MDKVIRAGLLQVGAHFITELAEASRITGSTVETTPDQEWFPNVAVAELAPYESDGIVFHAYEFRRRRDSFRLYVPPQEWQLEVPVIVDEDDEVDEGFVNDTLGTYVGEVLRRHLQPAAA